MKKSLFLVIFSIVLSINAFAQFDVDGIMYTIKADGTAEVKSAYTVEGDVVIPAAIVYDGVEYTVTSIFQYAFHNNKKIANITLPETMKEIGMGAFQESSLTSIVLPNSLKSIGADAFSTCAQLTELTIPGTVEYIGDYICQSCNKLEKIVLCEGIEKVPGEIIASCKNIKEVVLPSTLKIIGNYAFYGSCITTLEIPESVTTIGQFAFQMANKLEYIKIPESVTEIQKRAFYCCQKLKTVELPQGLRCIGDEAFSFCDSLTNINLPQSLKSIGSFVFYSSNKIVGDLTIPDSLEEIGNWAFSGLSIPNIVVPKPITNIPDGAFRGIKNVVTVQIHNDVETIGNYAFSGIDAESIVIPDKVESIGDYAFSSLNLKHIDIPNSVRYIGEGCFQKSSIDKVSTGQAIISIGYNAFYGCESLTSVIIGKGIQLIENGAFGQCKTLKDVYCFADNVPLTRSDVFGGTPIQDATLYVKDATMDTFKEAPVWCNFGNFAIISEEDVEKAEEDYVTDILDIPDNDTTGNNFCYDIFGRKVNGNYKGIVIKNGRKHLSIRSK